MNAVFRKTRLWIVHLFPHKYSNSAIIYSLLVHFLENLTWQEAGGLKMKHITVNLKIHSLTVVISHWGNCYPEGLTVVYVDFFWSHLITNRQVGNMWKRTKTHKHTNKRHKNKQTLPKQNTLLTSVLSQGVMWHFIEIIIECWWFNICEVSCSG